MNPYHSACNKISNKIKFVSPHIFSTITRSESIFWNSCQRHRDPRQSTTARCSQDLRHMLWTKRRHLIFHSRSIRSRRILLWSANCFIISRTIADTAGFHLCLATRAEEILIHDLLWRKNTIHCEETPACVFQLNGRCCLINRFLN